MRRKLTRLSIVLVTVFSVALTLSTPLTHAAPTRSARVAVPASTGPAVSKPTADTDAIEAQTDALFAAAPVQSVNTAVQSLATGYPTGTTYKEITRPNCFQPTVKEQNDAKAGKLTQAQMAADDLPTLAIAGSAAQLKVLLSVPLHADCNMFEALTGPEANMKMGNVSQKTAKKADWSAGYNFAGTTSVTSDSNWDGYIQYATSSDGGSWKKAQSEWVIPSNEGSSGDFNDGWDTMAQWVGLGGWNDGTHVFQIGTQVFEEWVSEVQTEVVYNTWIDLSPANEHTFGDWGGAEAGNQEIFAWVNNAYGYYMEDVSNGDYIPQGTYGTTFGSQTGYGLTSFECVQEATGSFAGVWVIENNVQFPECVAINADSAEIRLGQETTGDPYVGVAYTDPSDSYDVYYPDYSPGSDPDGSSEGQYWNYSYYG